MSAEDIEMEIFIMEDATAHWLTILYSQESNSNIISTGFQKTDIVGSKESY